MHATKACLEDWQGFQHFQDNNQTNHGTMTIHPNITRQVVKAEIKPNSLKKKSLVKKQEHHAINGRLEPIQLQISQYRHSLQAIQYEDVVAVSPKKAQSTTLRKFFRVPILKHEEDKHYAGRIIYKAFVPRSADTYFRILKQVKFTAPMEPKKMLHQVQFNSQFQAGNLGIVIESGKSDYDLYMRVDSNTNGHRQWFYFSMRNQTKGRIRLNLYRFRKQYSLFQRGMRPYGFSRKSEKGWTAVGQNVVYHRQKMPNDCFIQKKSKSFILSFDYTFENDDDQVFISAGIPYTYTYLQNRLSQWKTLMNCEPFIFQTSIEHSMCGLDMHTITIQHQKTALLKDSTKKIIVINARTHPGQTSSSWVLDGLMEQICTSKSIMKWMVQFNISIRVVPMLNPDGVFIGNYRSGILGDDFNRKFLTGKKQFYPQIFVLKGVISSAKKEGTVDLFLDLHGHSILKNSFLYGPGQIQFPDARLKQLPNRLECLSAYFRRSSCKFKQEDRVETARGYFHQKEKIFSYTCQNSLGLYQEQNHTYQLFTQDWKAFGKSIAIALTEIYTKQSFIPKIIHLPKQKLIKEEHFIPFQTKEKKTKIKKSLESMKTPSVSHEHVQDAFQSLLQKTLNDKKQPQSRFKIRRRSQVMKTPFYKAKHHKKLMQELPLINNQKQNSIQLNFFEQSRADTSNQTQLVNELRMLSQMKINQQEANLYDIQPIPENFSQEYNSMNDSDSSEEDLKEQQKIYIMEYIRANKSYSQQKIQVQSEIEKQVTSTLEPSINKFKEIRFKEIQKMKGRKDIQRINPKRKLDSIKFKEVTRSQKQKFTETEQFDDPSMVSISWQKKLYQRGRNLNRTQKQPFIMFQRKTKEDVSQQV